SRGERHLPSFVLKSLKTYDDTCRLAPRSLVDHCVYLSHCQTFEFSFHVFCIFFLDMALMKQANLYSQAKETTAKVAKKHRHPRKWQRPQPKQPEREAQQLGDAKKKSTLMPVKPPQE